MTTAKLVIIGDEILSGSTLDTNSVYAARRLHDLGVNVCEIVTIADRRDAIKSALAAGLEDFDVTIACGGLGPTPDDLTTGVAAKLFGKRLVLDDTVIQRIETHFKALKAEMPSASTKQAMVPQGAIVLENPVGMAPGLILVRDRKSLILLPGVPQEMERIFETGVAPYLEDTYYLTPLLVNIIRTTGIRESEIMVLINSWFARHKTVGIAYLPSAQGVDLKVWTEQDRKVLSQCQDELVARLKPHVYALSNTRIEEVVGEALRRRHLTLATAESCTGGRIADLVTNVPGSSDYFRGGAVAYSNELKKSMLGVCEATLQKHGAVSRETVIEMAAGARERFASDYALAVSGIAGPGGGTAAKPIGMVFVGLAGPKQAEAYQHHFAGARPLVKTRTAVAALDLLRRTLESL